MDEMDVLFFFFFFFLLYSKSRIELSRLGELKEIS